MTGSILIPIPTSTKTITRTPNGSNFQLSIMDYDVYESYNNVVNALEFTILYTY